MPIFCHYTLQCNQVLNIHVMPIDIANKWQMLFINDLKWIYAKLNVKDIHDLL